jgi:DMSO reductase iron-sulfur subunit
LANSFVFDPNRCTGCDACRLACTIENGLAPGDSWRRVETFNERHRPDLPLYHVSLACNHCAEPACMHACPALAYSRDPATGAVILDPDKCVGCKYCAWACPFDAPLFDAGRGVMTKCTFCNDRLKGGLQPACVALCPTDALGFGDLDETRTTQQVDAFPRTNLGPRVRIEPIRSERRLPAMTATESSATLAPATPEGDSGISLRSEWSLMLFTLLASTLVAIVATAATTSSRVDARAFAVAAAVTMGLASAHLGRKLRAWRAVLNLRRSWLSREIVSLGGFFVAATAWLGLAPGEGRTGIVIALAGFLGLLCADQVYGVMRRAGPGYRHSASVLWTGFFLTGVFSGAWWLALPIGVGKLALYVLRKLQFHQTDRQTRLPLSLARVALGFVIPLASLAADLPDGWTLTVVCVMVGEAIDRAEYYLELERDTPRRRIADVLLGLAPGSS